MVSKAKQRRPVEVAERPPVDLQRFLTIPVNGLPSCMFKIEKKGRHFNGYIWQGSPTPDEPGRWRAMFPCETILSSVLGALEREISDAAIAL